MLKSFERRLIIKFDEVKKVSSDAHGAVGLSTEDVKVFSAPGVGGWYHWRRQCRRVLHEYEFPNKII